MPTRPSSPTLPGIDLRVLGPVSVTRLADGARIATSPRQAALLAYLAIAEPRGPHARDVVAALLWPDADEERARRSLRNALHELRSACGVDAIISVGKHQLRLDREVVRCDLDALEARLAAGDPGGALAAWADLLDGLHVRGAEGFERWHERARTALRARLIAAAHRRAEARASAEPADAVALLEAARRLDPDDERLLRALLALQAALSGPAVAMRTFRAHAERLEREEGGAPAAEASALVRRLEAAASDLATLTVALEPLRTDAADPGMAELVRALDDGVRRRLSREPGVRVIARAALPMTWAPSLDEWRATGADLVASGELARVNDELRVRVEVMRTRDGAALRELQHRAPIHALFALEGVVAAAIHPPRDLIPGGAPTLPTPQPPRDAETHLLCMRGLWHFLRAAHVGGSTEDLERSRECFERAIAREPGYGTAYAGLSNYFAVCAARGIRRPFEDAFGQAIALSHRALELDASLAVPHVHFGVRALYLEGDWATARREFADAVRLDPGYAEAHRFLGIVLHAQGDRAAGLAALREAARLEPRTPLFLNSLADALLAEGSLGEAAATLAIALDVDPGYRAAAERLVRCEERAGRYEAAVATRVRYGAPGAERFATAFAADGAEGYARERRLELEAHVARLRDRLAPHAERTPAERFVPPELPLAVALAELGRWDEAWQVESSMPATITPWFASHPALAALGARRAARAAR